MRTRSTTIIAAGVLVAMIGAFTVVAYARSVQRSSVGGPSVSAWSAATNIDAGTKGEDASKLIKRVSVPKGIVPQAAVSDPATIVGRIAVRPISAGEIITASQFGATANGAVTAPAAGLQIPPGHNAVAVNMPLPQGGGRFVQSGDLVNIYATFSDARAADGKPQPTTKLLLSNVQVLSNLPAGQGTGKLGQSLSSELLLTLALKPQDVEKVVFAKETGSLWFALVHPGDGPVSTGGQTAATVLR